MSCQPCWLLLLLWLNKEFASSFECGLAGMHQDTWRVRLIVQSNLFSTMLLVPCKIVSVSRVSLWRCTAMHCQDRACPLEICHCDLDVTISKVTMTRSDCNP